VGWLGIDSSELTRRIKQWARAGEDKLESAFAFLLSASWPVFTERARALLDARPDDPQVKEALSRARDPFSSISFMGDLEPSYRNHADDYRRWCAHATRTSARSAKRPSHCTSDWLTNKRKENSVSKKARSPWVGASVQGLMQQ
jgi:hypothetical protein